MSGVAAAFLKPLAQTEQGSRDQQADTNEQQTVAEKGFYLVLEEHTDDKNRDHRHQDFRHVVFLGVPFPGSEGACKKARYLPPQDDQSGQDRCCMNDDGETEILLTGGP